MNTSGILASDLFKRIYVTAGVLICALAVFFLLRFIGYFILIIFAGILIGVMLDGMAGFIADRTAINRNFILSVIITLIIAAIVLFVYFGGPSIGNQISNMQEQVPKIITSVKKNLQSNWLGKYILDALTSSKGQAKDGLSVVSSFTGAVFTLLGVAGDIIIVALIGVYFAFDVNLYRKGFMRLFPKEKTYRVAGVVADVGKALRRWILGRTLAMTTIGIFTYIGLLIIGMPLSFFLGLIAAIFCFVPFIGPVLAAIPAFIVGLSVSVDMAFQALLMYTIIQILENDIITPLIQQFVTSLPPVVLISVQIIFGVIFGPAGLLLATPITVVIIVLIQDLYIREKLGYDIMLLGEKGKKDKDSNG